MRWSPRLHPASMLAPNWSPPRRLRKRRKRKRLTQRARSSRLSICLDAPHSIDAFPTQISLHVQTSLPLSVVTAISLWIDAIPSSLSVASKVSLMPVLVCFQSR
ncbi:hypothetical protein BDV19DRAFT_393725 [Aspergillus venezuelensis]